MNHDLTRLREAVAKLDGKLSRDEARRLVEAEKDANQNPPGKSHGSPAL